MNHRIVKSNGINMHLAEDGEGPFVVLCHGFPDLWCVQGFADSLRCTQARAQSAQHSCRCGSPSPLPGFCIAPYTPGALAFLLPSGPLPFFEFPCPSNRRRFTLDSSPALPL